MTENKTALNHQAPKPQRRGFGGPPGAGAMMPAEKAKNVKKTVKRLVDALRPQGKSLILVFIMAICSTVFSIVAPKVLAKVMDILIDGLKNKYMNPSSSFDFTSIGRIILQLALIYVVSAGFSWVTQYTMAGISQKTVYKLRQDVDRKLTRLPLKFFDQTPRGDILSRITNDGQHRDDPAAELNPAHHLADHDHRNPDHDAYNQPDPDPDLRNYAPDRHGTYHADRQILAEKLLRAVGIHRTAQRTD